MFFGHLPGPEDCAINQRCQHQTLEHNPWVGLERARVQELGWSTKTDTLTLDVEESGLDQHTTSDLCLVKKTVED